MFEKKINDSSPNNIINKQLKKYIWNVNKIFANIEWTGIRNLVLNLAAKNKKKCECEMNWKLNTVYKANKHGIYYKLKQK